MTVYPARARAFDAWAADYDRYRPPYPPEVFATISERLALPPRPDVADLGAGTGRASIAMARLGWRVTAVEPGGPMLDALRAAAADAGVEVATGQATAERTGLDDASVDLVTAAQAFHFFDRPAALREMARIVRPGGGIGLFWNVRDDDRSPLLADYSELLKRHLDMEHLERKLREDEVETRREIEENGLFEAPERIELHHSVPSNAEHFIGNAFTSSYVRLGLDDDGLRGFGEELATLIRKHHGDRPFQVPYQVDLWVARRRDR